MTPEPSASGVFDVASVVRLTGRAQQRDVRNSVMIRPPELPWPLTFHFLTAEEEDGSRRWANVGCDIGEAIRRDAINSSDIAEIKQSDVDVFSRRFLRYRRMAEQMLLGQRQAAVSNQARYAKEEPRRATD